MFTILNRLRGTYGWMAKITAIILGLVFAFVTDNGWIGLSMAVLYIFGESMGWGKWMGGIMDNQDIATPRHLSIKEGTSNGIDWITRLFFDEVTDYNSFCRFALTLRGIWWWFPTLLPLAVMSYISIHDFLITVLILGIGFPISVIIGNYTEKKFSYTHKNLGMSGAWEQSEVWYGFIQDLVLLYIIFSITVA